MQRLLSAAAAAFLVASVPAQSFSYPDFSDLTGLTLLGDAREFADHLTVSGPLTNRAGWCWRDQQVPVAAGFETTFVFRVTPSSGPQPSLIRGGIALVIHNDPRGVAATGDPGSRIGYGGVANSVAIELDLYLISEIAVHTRGTLPNSESGVYSLGSSLALPGGWGGLTTEVRIQYTPGFLRVYLDANPTPALSVPFGFADGGPYMWGGASGGMDLPNGVAYVGFAGGTPAFPERLEVLSWDWDSTPLPAACYEGSPGADILAVNGSDGGVSRRVHLATHQPFDINLDNPPGFGQGAPYLLLAALQASPGGLGTSLGFGEACFPMAPPFEPFAYVLADSFGLFPALLPSGPTPHSLTVPTGSIQLPVTLTLQGVTFTSGSPLTLGVTNAIELVVASAGPPTILSVSAPTPSPGQPVTIAGESFVPGLSLHVEGVAVPTNWVTAEAIEFPFPAGIPCDASLTVTNPDGQTVTATFYQSPELGSVVPDSGPAAGGQPVSIQGTGFVSGTTVTFGGVPATVLAVAPAVIVVTSPPGAPGAVPLQVTHPGGCSATTTYTYQ